MWRSKGHSVTSCSCTLMVRALISVEGMGGDIRVIVGHHVVAL